MNNRKAVTSVLALILGLAVVAFAIAQLGRGVSSAPGLSDKAYYYDLNTGELFVAGTEQIPPIDAPSGPLQGTPSGKAGVRAYVFTCGSDSESDRFIAWIETYTPEAQQALRQGDGAHTHPLAQGIAPLVARVNPSSPDSIQWFSQNSPKGTEIARVRFDACSDGSSPTPCLPQ